MSERDDTSGQFTPAEPLTGQAGVEAAAGFKPMPERNDADSETFATPREAAAQLAESRSGELVELPFVNTETQIPFIERPYVGIETGEPVDENETITAERGARDLAEVRKFEGDHYGKSISSDFAAEVDKRRTDAIEAAPDPKAAEEFYGVKKPDTATDTAAAAAADAETAAQDHAMRDSGLDPEVERALKHPQVREAIDQEFSRAETVKHEYSRAVSVAHDFARASFIENFPELAGLPIEHLQGGLEMMAQVAPDRFNAAMGTLQRVASIQQEQHQQNQRNALASQQQFQEYKRTESVKFDVLVPMSNAEKNSVAEEAAAELEKLGIDRQTLMHLNATNPIMHHSVFNKILTEWVQYTRLKAAPPKAIPTPVPPVQRPGTTQRVSAEASSIDQLNRKLASATSERDQIRLAAQLVTAKRAARR